jgi:hypothetical protein
MLRRKAEEPGTRKRGRAQRLALALTVVLAIYLVIAYLVLPFGWLEYAKGHPYMDDNPRLTETGDGHPGDPLNVALIGSEAEIEAVMAKAGWTRAGRLDMRNDLGIAADSVFDRADADAPVSSVGDSPRRRNHVRLWRLSKPNATGRPTWIGAASYDAKVGLSHTTGQVTHHIAPDVDTERDRLAADLNETGELSDSYLDPGFHKVLTGRNGGGDPWQTDGALWVGVIAAGSS